MIFEIVNRGDGVKGHYCIRRIVEYDHYEMYNGDGKWSTAGTVYVGMGAVGDALINIEAWTGCSIND